MGGEELQRAQRMKILLLGKNGQVGWELQRSLAPLGEVLALDSKSSDYCGDLRDLDGLAATVQRFAPDVIVTSLCQSSATPCSRP